MCVVLQVVHLGARQLAHGLPLCLPRWLCFSEASLSSPACPMTPCSCTCTQLCPALSSPCTAAGLDTFPNPLAAAWLCLGPPRPPPAVPLLTCPLLATQHLPGFPSHHHVLLAAKPQTILHAQTPWAGASSFNLLALWNSTAFVLVLGSP